MTQETLKGLQILMTYYQSYYFIDFQKSQLNTAKELAICVILYACASYGMGQTQGLIHVNVCASKGWNMILHVSEKLEKRKPVSKVLRNLQRFINLVASVILYFPDSYFQGVNCQLKGNSGSITSSNQASLRTIRYYEFKFYSFPYLSSSLLTKQWKTK